MVRVVTTKITIMNKKLGCMLFLGQLMRVIFCYAISGSKIIKEFTNPYDGEGYIRF